MRRLTSSLLQFAWEISTCIFLVPVIYSQHNERTISSLNKLNTCWFISFSLYLKTASTYSFLLLKFSCIVLPPGITGTSCPVILWPSNESSGINWNKHQWKLHTIKPHCVQASANQMNNKRSMSKKQKTPFFAPWCLLFGHRVLVGGATIPYVDTKHYSVSRIFLFNI